MDAGFDAAVLGRDLPTAVEAALADAGADCGEPVRAMAAAFTSELTTMAYEPELTPAVVGR